MLWTPSLNNGLEVFEQAGIRWKRRQGRLSNGLNLKDEASGLIVVLQTNDVTRPIRHTLHDETLHLPEVLSTLERLVDLLFLGQRCLMNENFQLLSI